MARQGYDLQLTRYDEKLACDLLHDRDGTLADHRDGTAWERTAVARDAAGGVGGAEEEARERVGGARWKKTRTTYTHCWSAL